MNQLVVIDNYDSFTYNLVHLLEKVTLQNVDVYRNDEVEVDKLSTYSHIIISPGPGLPQDAGVSKLAIEKFSPSKKILGVCLGHQAIGEVFGASLINLPTVFHGVATKMNVLNSNNLFKNIPDSFLVGRYHSWGIKKGLPESLELLAADENGNPMAIKHKHFQCYGVQYHPESILSEYGEQLIKNWMNL
ncbi:MAG: aminodeoxychorismate/anthranilate synthase component II [Bacteroidetes bacterium]|nr:aminodeoxychorismate/anthranilate synthase component II [Bacteroidota bacterium]